MQIKIFVSGNMLEGTLHGFEVAKNKLIDIL